MSDLQNLTPANTYKALLQLGDYTDGISGDTGANALQVSDGAGNNTSLALSTDRVGIGNTSPSAELDVSGDVVADEYALDQTGSSSSAVAIHAPATNELAIRTNSAERVRIDSSGNCGIGTTSPEAKLHIAGDSTNLGGLLIGHAVATGIDSFRFYIDSNNKAHITRGASEKISILNNGNVGVGTTSPSRKLDVQGVQGWQDSGGVERAGLNPATDGADFQLFDSSGTSNIRLDSRSGGDNYFNNGNFGIGTTSPSAPLEVSSTTGGVIMPRMTTTQMNAISSPTDGEMIYNTTANKFYGRANGAWVALH